jgi:CRP/FNR family transcriptional regulator, anaerobic regulatory protein
METHTLITEEPTMNAAAMPQLATHEAPASRTIRIKPELTRQATSVPTIKTSCSVCHLRDLCLPCGMTQPDMDRLDSLTFGRRKIKSGQTLYREGDKFQYIYAVRSGTLKSSLMLADGREQVSGFHIAGELVGLDGVAQGQHASATMALEDTEICAIPYAHLSDLAANTAGMQHVISRMMSREIMREHSLMMLLGSMNAEERLAAFLLNLSQRYAARGYSEREFHLRMSRAEIGSYLGMKLETVSRTFSAFQQQRLMEVDKRHIRILDMEGLRQRFEVRVH